MRIKSLFALPLAALLATPLPALAADAEIYAVHGINGKDLGLNQNLPVDVSVDGACALTNFKFGEIAGPLTLPAGTYSIAVTLRDRDNPCGGATAIAGNIQLRGNRTYSIVAHLDEDGVPTASRIRIDRRPIRDGYGRLLVVHGAAAPRVDATLSRPSSRGRAVLEGISNGRTAGASLARAVWQARIFPALNDPAVAGPAAAPVGDGQVTVVYAVGSLAGGTLGLLAQVVETRE